jgi:hypothetical protein
MTRKAVGSRGSWFAKVGDETMPCIHKHWLRAMLYHEPFCEISEQRWLDYVNGLRGGKAILTTDKVVSEEVVVLDDGTEVKRPTFQRSGYVAVYRITEVSLVGRDLKFELVERLEELL